MKKKIFILGVLLSVILISMVSALDEIKQDRIDFGYVLLVKSIGTEPSNLVPGKPGILKVEVENNANFQLFDIRADIEMPSGISLIDGTSKRKIFRMGPGEVSEFSYKIVASPGTSEGIYEGNLSMEYLNHIATERVETYEFGMAVKSDPLMFIQVEDSEIYQGNNVGEVSIKFVNNDIGNIKFLTVELEDSEDYDILSPKKQYIGDLDSDDFESVDFKLKENGGKEEIDLLLKIDYKDTLNEDYTGSVNMPLKIRTPSELGIESNNFLGTIIVVIIILVLAYFGYRRWKKKKKKREKY